MNLSKLRGIKIYEKWHSLDSVKQTPSSKQTENYFFCFLNAFFFLPSVVPDCFFTGFPQATGPLIQCSYPTGTMNILIPPCAARLPTHLYQHFVFSAMFLLLCGMKSTHPQSYFTILWCPLHPQFLCPYTVLSFWGWEWSSARLPANFFLFNTKGKCMWHL